MTSKNRKHFFQKNKLEQLTNRKKQHNYDLRFSVIEKKKTYDALEDPHASYYFYSQSVRNHLKSIKRPALNETFHSSEKKRLKKLFNQKIKAKPKSFFIKQAEIYDEEQIITTKNYKKSFMKTINQQRKKSPRRQSERQTKLSISTNNRYMSLSKRHFNKTQNYHDRKQNFSERNSPEQDFFTDNFQSNYQAGIELEKKKKRNKQDLQRIKKQQVQKRKKRYEELHEKRHKNFLNFIEEKRKQLQNFQQRDQIQNM